MKIIDNRKQTIHRAEDFIDKLTQDVFLIGRNKYSISLINWLKSINKNVIGFIDDFSDLDFYYDLPIFKSNRDFKQFAIINCVVEGRTIDVNSLIISLLPNCYIDYFALQFCFSNDLIPVDFLNNTNTILTKSKNYYSIYSILADEQSKVEFNSIINFRLNRDIYFLKELKYKLNNQYFEDFITLPNSPCFIDGGGYDGSTSLAFIKKYSDYNKIYYFEPNFKSMEQSKINLFRKKNVEFIQKGLWNFETTLHFDSENGGASTLSENGTEIIRTVTIDSVIANSVNFIKLDIEGSEIEALIGAKNTILNYKPILAICVYHKQTDFIEVPKLILKINPLYKVYLRHYSQGVFETVMYFI
jgi:FkbM family methyltransferase